MYKAILAAAFVAATPALASAASAPAAIHVRGTIVSTSATSIVVSTASGSTQTIALAPKVKVIGVVNSSLDKVGAGEFIGTTVAPQANGSLKALEVHIFPPALKGTGEGYYPWDKQQKSMMANATVQTVGQSHGSMMANATVKTVGAAAAGRTVTLVYKGGTQSVTIPAGVPIVALEAGSTSLLTAGAHVFVIASPGAAGRVANAIVVGKNGVVPPM